jgi:YihY family inner membrane protein
MNVRASVSRADRYQRRHPRLAFLVAVWQKYSDDEGGRLSAALAYYGVYSIFPLLLIFVSVLGFVLRGHPKLERSIVDSALGQFPVIGAQLQNHSLQGSVFALAVGIAGSLWAGMRVFLAGERVLNQIWGVPPVAQPTFLRARARALSLLLVVGLSVLVATGLAGLSTVGAGFGILWKLGAVALSAGLNIGLFWFAFWVLTRGMSWREVRGGAIAAGLAYVVLQLAGGIYVHHVLEKANSTYGTFALVIGLLSWLYLAAHIVLLAGESNVVATKRLWPRSISRLSQEAPTDADEAALLLRADAEKRRSDEAIDVLRHGAPPGR